MNRYAKTLLLVLLLALAWLPVKAGPVFHADYDRSEPAADAVLSEAPTRVKVWFTQELFRREGENWLHVFGPDGARVDLDDTVVDDDDRTLLIVSLAAGLGDGEYRVEWRALSADDGHPKEGSFAFQVAGSEPADAEASTGTPAPTPETTAEPTPEPLPTDVPETPASSPSSSSSGNGLPCLGASPLVMLALGIVVLRRRNSPRG